MRDENDWYRWKMESYLLSKLPFPTALIPCILEYSQLRPDWRTCCTPVSNLIKDYKRLVEEQVENPNAEMEFWVFDNDTLREMREWSLFGAMYILWWLDDGGMDRSFRYGRRPPIRPLETYYRNGENYKNWYTQSFMCSCAGV